MASPRRELSFPFLIEGDAACEYVRDIGLRHARTVHLPAEDCEECALELVVRLYRRLASSPSWLNTCARNCALNFRRRADRLRAHEVRLTAAVVNVTEDGRGSQPLHCLCRSESLSELAAALASLKPTDEEYLLRTYYGDASPAEIAVHVHRRIHAVEQGISRARKRLAVVLLPTGCTADDFCVE